MKIVNGWVDVAVEIDYLNKSMPRAGHKPTHIVLHGTAGGSQAQNTANYFKTSAVQSSAHLIIGQDGTIVQGVSMDNAAWGNGILLNPRLPWPPNVNPNLYTISIEHCKPSTDNSDQLTDAQKQSSFGLIKCICEYYGIPKKRGDVTGGIVEHADFDSVNRARCPGLYPWDKLLEFLSEPALPAANITQALAALNTAALAIAAAQKALGSH
jgi:N-acetyl-anhydromuramyl-L-alanine amidase AmpD